MKHGFTLLFILIFSGQAIIAQSTEGVDACQTTKVRYFGKLFKDAQGRKASLAEYQSGLAYPGDSAIDVTYYGLDLRLTHTPAYLNGAVTITIKAKSANLNRFFLDAQPQLTIDSVKSAGRKLTFTRETNRVQITPPQPLSAGQALTLTVFYQGNPKSGAGFVRVD